MNSFFGVSSPAVTGINVTASPNRAHLMISPATILKSKIFAMVRVKGSKPAVLMP